MNILYIGNRLSVHGLTPTGVETLGEKLAQFSNIKLSSNKRYKIIRLFDMILTIIINRRSTDYVLIDTYSGLAFIYTFTCSILCRIIGLNYLPILRGGDLPKMLFRKKAITKAIFSNSKNNIAPSFYIKSKFDQLGIKSVYIPNSIDINRYTYKIRQNCRPRLLWVRSFHRVYNPIMAIKVFSKIKEEMPSAQLCMVGPDKDGSLKICKELVNRLNFSNCVRFTKILSKKDWINLSSEYDIFLNTTNFDNQPVSVIEAMALGLPIVSTNAGGLPYLHNNGVDALLVNKNDVNKMAQIVLKVIKDKSLASRLSMNARMKAEKFDWYKVQASWIKELNIHNHEKKNVMDKSIEYIYDIYMSEKSFFNKWSKKNIGNIVIEEERFYKARQMLKYYNIDLKNKKILDIGCAGGNTVKMIIGLGANERNIYGIDIRQNRINDAINAYPYAKFSRMDVRNMKYSDEEFDVINIFTLFSSIKDSKSRNLASKEIQRVLKPGGAILYYDIRYNNPFNRNVLQVKYKDIKSLFPNMKKELKLITVLPPLVRLLGGLAEYVYPKLSKIPFLNTHHIGLMVKDN